MNVERVLSYYSQRPVRPFTIHTASGESYTVTHPETMAIGAEDEVVILLNGPDTFAILDMPSITEILANAGSDMEMRPVDVAS